MVGALSTDGRKGATGQMADQGHLLLASAVTASAGHHGHSSPRGDGSDNLLILPGSVRRPTPRESERLMGWPDDWTRWRGDGSEIADGPRYAMIGNGVVAPVARWLAERMRATLEASPPE